MPAAGAKGTPKNQGELKDDTSSSREEKQVFCYFDYQVFLLRQYAFYSPKYITKWHCEP